MNKVKPLVLAILDGFGHSEKQTYNAITAAKCPNFSSWMAYYPHTLLSASGQAVGLLPGMVGNSEVGHLTIGAGRIIPQPASIISKAIEDRTFFSNVRLQHALNQIKKRTGTLHIMGLVSDAGVHSSLQLMQAAIQVAYDAGVSRIVVHPFLDGRDVVPRSAAQYLEQLEKTVAQCKIAVIGSLHGRFYAMDRDKNWDRIKMSYDILTKTVPSGFSDWRSALDYFYAQGISDEFIPPTQLYPDAVIQDGDGIFFTNYRPDRARELTVCFLAAEQVPFTTKNLQLSCFITPVSYDTNIQTTVLFDRPTIEHTLKDVLAQHHKKIVSIAETEKYAHVTYFFNGEREQAVPGETRFLIPSIKADTYRDYPEMSAAAITHKALESLAQDPANFYLINYANADMVGHSGDMHATIKAVECLDVQLGVLYEEVVQKLGWTLIITADHGKAELMYDEALQQPYTGHTTNPVPFLVISSEMKLKDAKLPAQLSEIAPFILRYMGLPVPNEMK